LIDHLGLLQKDGPMIGFHWISAVVMRSYLYGYASFKGIPWPPLPSLPTRFINC
jgi:hypothetical protein